MKIETEKQFEKLEDILQEIEEKTGYTIVFEIGNIEINGKTIVFTGK